MSSFTVEVLNQVEELANQLVTPDDIATILELNKEEFKEGLKNNESDLYKAFYRGFLKRDIEVKKGNLNPTDVESAEFTDEAIKKYRLKILIQLD